MIRKKIMFLGGAHSQLPAILFAKSRGYFIITLDYLPKNPGHEFSDEYYNISTTEKELVLKIALKLKIDAISAYASDPSALTAAYISDHMGLIGGTFKAVQVLSDKGLFRQFTLKSNFKTPLYQIGCKLSDLNFDIFNKKAVLKPADSSGSKGVFVVKSNQDIKLYFNRSLEYSKSKKVIIEQFIERKGPQIHGEGYVEKGILKFIFLGDQYFSPFNSVAPYSTIVPTINHSDISDELTELVQLFITKVEFDAGGINIELIRDKNDNIYIMEIGARNGGNFMPQLIEYATGFDLVKANINGLFGETIEFNLNVMQNCHFAQIILHSDCEGRFEGIQIPEIFKNNLLEKNIYYKVGEKINVYRNSRDVIGVILLDISGKVDEYIKCLNEFEWVKIKKV